MAAEVREFALSLPRTTVGVVSDSLRFRIGTLVYAAFSRDEQSMGFAYPKDERAELIAAEPDKFRLPRASQLRYNWVVCQLDQIDHEEMHELILDAWRMCVPKKIAAEYLGE
jgi:hypothetical protein